MASRSLPEHSDAARKERTAAIVLVGGKSSRMGRDKATLELGGVPFVVRVVDAVSSVVDLCVVARAHGQVLPLLPEGVLVVDDATAHRGPLVALEQAMSVLPKDIRRCFVCATDLPWLAPAVVRCLLGLAADYEITVVERNGLQLLAGVYSTTLRSRMAALIGENISSMKALLRSARVRIVTPSELLQDAAVRLADPTLSSFDDVDSPADFVRAE